MLLKFIIGLLISYQWPITPFNQQHNISGTFGEFRHGPPIHFHNAVDIPASEGTPVYAVEGGVVLWIGSGFNGGIRVGRFAYVHVVPRSDLQLGDTVTQWEVVGYINSAYHVHFKDGGGASSYPLVNPLLQGNLSPFEDPWGTNVYSVTFFSHYLGNYMNSDSLYGQVDIVAGALDTTGSGTIGSNNGVFQIYYALFSSDTDSIIVGPHRLVQFVHLPSTPVDEVYYVPWSNNQNHYYIVTNSTVKARGSLDLKHIPEGDYVLAVYASDTRDNWDTNFVNIHVVPTDTTPPAVPKLEVLKLLPDGRAYLRWKPDTSHDLAGYKVYIKFGNSRWVEWANVGPSDSSFTTSRTLTQNWNFYFRVIAYDNQGNLSYPSNIFVIRRTESPDKVLIVDGIENEMGHDYFSRYLDGLENITVETISESSISETNLRDYQLVIVSKGMDSTALNTTTLLEYLNAGGHIFINGGKIAKILNSSTFLDLSGVRFLQDSSGIDTVVSRPCGPFYDLTAVISTGKESNVIDTISGSFGVFSFKGDGYAGILNRDTSVIFFSFSIDHAEDSLFTIQVLRDIYTVFGLTSVSESYSSIDHGISISYSFDGSLFLNGIKHDEKLGIFDPAGRRVFFSAIHPYTKRIKIGRLPSGLYFIKIGNKQVFKIMVVR